MRHGLYSIDNSQISEIMDLLDLDQTGREITGRYAALSSPLVAGFCKGELLGFVGLLPPTILSPSAYIWMHETQAIARHKMWFARQAKSFLANMFKLYDNISGNCFATRGPRWVESLGGEFIDKSGPVTSFIFRKPQ